MKKHGIFSKISVVIIILLMTVSMLASCGSANKDYAGGDDYVNSSPNKAPTLDNSNGAGEGGIGNVPSGGIDNPAAKIIKTANAEMSTTEYDQFLTDLYAKITEFSGYTDGETFSGSSKYRRATVTIRIPAARHEEFKSALSGLGTMTYYSADKQDVTLTYATLKAEVDTLTAEIEIVEELFEIAKQSGDLKEISNVEEKLTELRLRVAQANARLSVYDNSIAYSTIYLTVYEREIIEEPEPEPDPTAFERIGKNLKNAFTGIGNFFVDLFVFLVSAVPYLLVISLFAAIPVTVIILVKRKRRRGKKSDGENQGE